MTAVPVFVGHVEQHAVAGDPRVVDDDAQAPKAVGVATSSSAVERWLMSPATATAFDPEA